jgi:hypothetical protein
MITTCKPVTEQDEAIVRTRPRERIDLGHLVDGSVQDLLAGRGGDERGWAELQTRPVPGRVEIEKPALGFFIADCGATLLANANWTSDSGRQIGRRHSGKPEDLRVFERNHAKTSTMTPSFVSTVGVQFGIG